MTKFSTSRHYGALVALFFIAFALGCGGGGGGGGGGAYVPTGETEEAPTAVSTLKTAQSLFTTTSASQNLIMTIPVVSGKTANFLMTVTNNSGSSQLVGLAPATSFAASVKPLETTLNTSRFLEPDLELVQKVLEKDRLQEKLRQNTINALRQGSGKFRKSLHASNHSNEVEGGIYPIKLVSNSRGTSYITRSFKLERKKDNLYKIFVDQDEYQELDAKDGSYSVTNADIDHFADELEDFILPFMQENYGKIYDIDNDGCLSILISPVYANLGFAGLFNTEDMVQGAGGNDNQRDLIGIWSPSSDWVDGITTTWNTKRERWLSATRETIAHEMQHAINFSAKVFPGGSLTNSGSIEEVWLDEGLCVSAEARYRKLRGDAGKTTYVGNNLGGSISTDFVGNDNRFNYWINKPTGSAIKGWASEYSHYGQKGLFLFYIYEQFGANKIKEIVQNTSIGMTNLNNVLGADFNSLVKNWQFAVINEGLRTSNLIDVNTIDSRYRYQAALMLNTVYKAVQYDAKFPEDISVAPGAVAFYVIRQPSSTVGLEYKFIVESAQGQSIEINMMRLP